MATIEKIGETETTRDGELTWYKVGEIKGVDQAIIFTGPPKHMINTETNGFRRVGVMLPDSFDRINPGDPILYPFEQEGGITGDMPTYALTNEAVIEAAIMRAIEMRESHGG